jgi:hypothetical protein
MVAITLEPSGEEPTSFNVDLDLHRLDAPPDAVVYVEAYVRSQWYRRYIFGTIGNVRPPADRTLAGLPSADSLRFRVKVVTRSGHRGRLIAAASGLKAINSPAALADQGILDFSVQDIGEAVWTLTFDGDLPALVLNSDIPRADAVAKDPLFAALVYPAIVRAILSRVVFVEEVDLQDEDDVSWAGRWLAFARTFNPDPLPSRGDSAEQLMTWIEDTTRQFESQRQMKDDFLKRIAVGL